MSENDIALLQGLIAFVIIIAFALAVIELVVIIDSIPTDIE